MQNQFSKILLANGIQPYEELASTPVPFNDVQEQVGVTGTNIRNGEIKVEQNPRLAPALARGMRSQPGLLEEAYRTNAGIMSAVTELDALVKGANYTVNESDPRLQPYVDKAVNAIKRCMPDIMNNIVAMIKYGFAPYEIVWSADGLPHKVLYREASTVNKWLLDQNESELIGVQFTTGSGRSYILETNGGNMDAERFLLFNVHAQGLNFEGMSPIRVAMGYHQLQQLVLNTFAITAERYGVPIVQIMKNISDTSSEESYSSGSSLSALEALAADLNDIRSSIPPVVVVSDGYKIEFATPQGQMPDPTPMLNFLDNRIATCFSNEGSTLASSGKGSYAMAKVEESRFKRSAPIYAMGTANGLTRLLHLSLQFQGAPTDVEWPTFSTRFADHTDTSRWLTDVTNIYNSGLIESHPELAKHISGALGLPMEVMQAATQDKEFEVNGSK